MRHYDVHTKAGAQDYLNAMLEFHGAPHRAEIFAMSTPSDPTIVVTLTGPVDRGYRDLSRAVMDAHEHSWRPISVKVRYTFVPDDLARFPS